jgi:hypothetical protein
MLNDTNPMSGLPSHNGIDVMAIHMECQMKLMIHTIITTQAFI